MRAASIAVDTTAESPGTAGDCTLGEAILAANTDSAVDGCPAGSEADTITLPAGTYSLATVVTTGAGESAFVVSTPISITGPGATLARDAGAADLRFFEVTSSGNLTLDRLTLSGGLARGLAGAHANPVNGGLGEPGQGGAIHNSGTLTLLDVVLIGNRAAGGPGGHGSSSFPSRGGDAGPGQGGAVYNAGTLTAFRTTFAENTAAGGAGGGGFQDNRGGDGGAGQGGALYSGPATTLALNDSELRENRAEGGLSGFCSPSGLCVVPSGAASGGAVFSQGTLTIARCVLADNAALAGSGYLPGTGGGGAIAAESGTLNLTGSVVSGNTSTGGMHGGGVPRDGGLGIGGGLHIQNATADVRQSALIDNTAVGGAKSWPQANQGAARGGAASALAGVLAITNTTFSGNAAAQNGGGAYVDAASTLTLGYSTVASNTSSAGAAGLANTSGSVTLTGSIVANNTGASGNCSGAIADGGSSLQYPGGTCGGIPVGDPALGPLEASGGTFVHPLLPGSPALDAADNPACPPIDQRGMPRPADGDGDGTSVCDIGAYEAQVFVAPPDLIFRDGFESEGPPN